MNQARPFTQEEYKLSETEKTAPGNLRISGGMTVDDRLVRGIGVPFFGMAIPTVTGLAGFHNAPSFFVITSYLYFILIAGIVWEGNRFLLFRYYPEIFQSRSSIQKYALMTGVNIFYTVPVGAFLIYFWKWLTNSDALEHDTIWITVAVVVVFVIFISNMYEKVLLVKYAQKEVEVESEGRRFDPVVKNKVWEARLIVRKGLDYCPIDIGNIAYIFTEHKISFVCDKKNELYMADQSLSELEEMINAAYFFRANRQYIVNIDAIVKFRSTSESKIKLELSPRPKGEVVIGKERAVEFRIWVKGIIPKK